MAGGKTMTARERKALARQKVKDNIRTAKDVRQVVGRMAETKFLSVVNSAISQLYTWTQTDLSVIPRGTTDSERIGDSVAGTSFNMQYNIIGGDPANLFRVVIVRWKVGDNPNSDSIFATNGSVLAPLSNYNHDHRNTFEILYDKTHQVTLTDTLQSYHTIRLNLKGKKIKFAAGASNVHVSGGIYLLTVSDSGLAPNPFISYCARLKYRDM